MESFQIKAVRDAGESQVVEEEDNRKQYHRKRNPKCGGGNWKDDPPAKTSKPLRKGPRPKKKMAFWAGLGASLMN